MEQSGWPVPWLQEDEEKDCLPRSLIYSSAAILVTVLRVDLEISA